MCIGKVEISSGMKLKIWAVVSQGFQTRHLAFLIFVLYLVLRVLSAAERDRSRLSRLSTSTWAS